MASPSPSANKQHSLIGVGVLVVGVLMAWGASSISSEAGYAGVGPNFLPWVVSLALIVCGCALVYEGLSGGFRKLEAASGAERGDWRAVAWVLGGLLVNAMLIEHIGFVLSCSLCFAMAVRGMRGAQGHAAGGFLKVCKDFGTGLAIALPVYWLFTKGLSINLPGLTGTGWL